jgi:hypothetical protein
VTVPGHRAGQPGIHVHGVRHLHPEDCTMIDGIPVTSLERTLLDYAESPGSSGLDWPSKPRSDRTHSTPPGITRCWHATPAAPPRP